MDFVKYMEKFKGKRVALAGFGISNRAVCGLLMEAGAEISVFDKKEVEDNAKFQGVRFFAGENYLKELEKAPSFDYIFRTPGFHPHKPELDAAIDKGARLTSEMETFFDVCPGKIIGVTGSSGKTTTSTLIFEMLKNAGISAYLGGNIGTPLLPLVKNMCPEDIAVVELSSFQLMTMEKGPEIAVITNVTPNHLDMHKDMAEYIGAKHNILKNPGSGAFAVLNADNEISTGFAKGYPGRVSYFSRKTRPENGAYLEDGRIFTVENGKSTLALDAGEVRLPGIHNLENIMAALCAVRGLCPLQKASDAAKAFGGVPHRLELVRELEGVRYYNDSIATAPERAIAGLRCFDCGIVLLAGGYDKKLPFDDYAREIIERVRVLILCGDTAQAICDSVKASPGYRENRPVILRADNFEEAVKLSRENAQRGEVVLLSPACAAFDQFKDFAARGERFREIVLGF